MQSISGIFYDSEKEYYLWDENHEGEFWMRKIGGYYNNPDRIGDYADSERLLHANRLKESLQFVLYYYYRNRLLLSQSFSNSKDYGNGKWDCGLRREWLGQFTEIKREGGD